MGEGSSSECFLQHGLTLIEVMIALVIVSIAITAIIMAVSQRTRAMTYLHDKTIATMVGQQILNEIEVNLFIIPPDSVAIQKTTYMLGEAWYVHISTSATHDPHIQKITVCVFSHLPITKHSPVTCVRGYRNNDA